MTYAQAIASLEALGQFGMRLGLDRMHRLAAACGNPQDRLRFIHVAGTNGKGSVCAFLESIYRAAGLRVGLFTSPHLVHFGERIQVDRRPLPEAAIVSLVRELEPLHRGSPADDKPTLFEIATLMALLHFERSRVDVVIWETGLGGRLDATNIVLPLASVITSIGFDHQQWLGSTLPEIAREKAGILKSAVPGLTAASDPGAVNAIRETAAELCVPLTVLHPGAAEHPALRGRRLPLPGPHQRMNAALALETVDRLRHLIPVPAAAVDAGLSSVQWPGRFQMLQRADQTLVLDGAHNLEGVAALRAAIESEFPGRKPVLVLGILRDKSWREMLAELLPAVRELILVPVQSDRTLRPEEMLPACGEIAPGTPARGAADLGEAMESVDGEPLVVIAGSLYLIGEAMDRLIQSPDTRPGERRLNEWRSSQG